MSNNYGSMGIGTMIVFIAMILVAGIAASVMIQTMSDLQNKANRTGRETIRDISTGIEVRQVSGYVVNSKIDQLALYISPIVASEGIDLSHTVIFLSDSNNEVMLKYDDSMFSSSVSNDGLFHTLNSSNLTSSSFGIVVVRDKDNSCTASNPVINEKDIVVLIVNTTKCFSGLSPRTEVWGRITPEYGISGIISFTVPSVLIDRVVDLQP
ncbi:MAG: flagellin [Thermoplasmata archaeon]|nr:MAG: flagellin [Thermoplasmata archaeon]KAA0015228.1 MAG: flagellin [Thermoplasmata archaeon]